MSPKVKRQTTKGRAPVLEPVVKRKRERPTVPITIVVAKNLDEMTDAAGRPETTRAETVSSVARLLIMNGATNEEILQGLKERFPYLQVEVGGRHRYYAGWFRRQVAKRGGG